MQLLRPAQHFVGPGIDLQAASGRCAADAADVALRLVRAHQPVHPLDGSEPRFDVSIDNPDLERLEALLDQFNLFEALGIVRQELRHSDLLAFLLDAQHGVEEPLAAIDRLEDVAAEERGPVAGVEHQDAGTTFLARHHFEALRA